MSLPSRVLLLSLLQAAAASAQITMTVTGTISASAVTDGSRQDRGGPFPGPFSASSFLGWGTAQAFVQGAATGLTCSLDATLRTDLLFPGMGSAEATATASLLVTYRAPVPTAGRMVCTGYFASFDVGDDGWVDLPSGQGSIPVAIGPSGLAVRIRALGRASGLLGVGFVQMTCRFDAAPMGFNPYGPTCNIELLGARSLVTNQDTFLFVTRNAPQSPFALLVLGLNQLALPIPPTNCLLLTDLPIVLPIVLTAGGNATRFTLPHVPGLSFLAQTLVSETPPPDPQWRTSNGIRVVVP